MKLIKLFWLLSIFILPACYGQGLEFLKNIEIKNQKLETIAIAEQLIMRGKNASEPFNYLIKLSSVIRFSDEKKVSRVDYVDNLYCTTYKFKNKKYHFITATIAFVQDTAIVIVVDEKLNYITTLKNNKYFKAAYIYSDYIHFFDGFPWYEYILGAEIQEIEYLKDKNLIKIYTHNGIRLSSNRKHYIFTYSISENFKLLNMTYQ